MSELSATHLTANASTRIPENATTVSFDVRLGKRYQYIDFDYQAFETEANRLELPSEEWPKLSIHYEGGSGGLYEPEKKKIHVGMAAIHGASHTTSHELQHAADDAKGLLECFDTRSRIGAVSRIGVLITMVPGIVSVAAMPFSSSETLAGIEHGTAATLAAMVAGFIYGAWYHPQETRALHASETSQVSIIRAIPRE